MKQECFLWILKSCWIQFYSSMLIFWIGNWICCSHCYWNIRMPLKGRGWYNTFLMSTTVPTTGCLWQYHNGYGVPNKVNHAWKMRHQTVRSTIKRRNQFIMPESFSWKIMWAFQLCIWMDDRNTVRSKFSRICSAECLSVSTSLIVAAMKTRRNINFFWLI